MQDAICDLTIIMLTANEHPEEWTKFHFHQLLGAGAVYPYPLIISTIQPVQWFTERLTSSIKVIYQTESRSHRNMYRQLLKACKLATTPYIAVAESDTLYSKEHFSFCRPPMDTVAYDMSRWVLFTWRPIFSMRRRMNNSMMIAPREYLIEALEERYGDDSKVPDDRVGEVGRHIHEQALGLKLRNAVEVWCYHPSIQLSHENNISYAQAHHPTKKTLGEMKANSIPDWGKAEDIANEYH